MRLRFNIVFLFLIFIGKIIIAQPGRLEGNFGAGWSNYDLIDRGIVKAVTLQSTVTNFNAQFLFNNINGNYNPQWTGSNAPNVFRLIDSILIGQAFYYSSGGWNQNLETSIEAGKYYTFIIRGNDAASTNNRDMSILQTSFLPTSINAVSQTPISPVNSGMSVDITVTLSKVNEIGENVFLRYTTDNWTSSNFVNITNFNGSFQGIATIPAQLNGTTVKYYVLTTKKTNPNSSTIDYYTLNVNNNNNNNYEYSVVGGVVAPTITISDDGNITEGSEDGEIITVSLNNDLFVATLNPSNWTLTNLPTGVNAGLITRLNDTIASISLSGNSTVDYDTDITNLTLEITSEELQTLSSGTVSANSGVIFKAIVENDGIWLHMLTYDNFTHKLGDNTSHWINAEIGQASWAVSQIGYGISNTDTTGWIWEDATWYEDGVGNNKRVHSLITVPNAITNYYYNARAKADINDDWHYANDTTWANNPIFAPSYSVLIDSLPAPTNCISTANSSSQIVLSWNNDVTYQEVIILSKKDSDISTSLINGQIYNQGDSIDNVAVIYKGTAQAFNHNTLIPSTQYFYNFYTVNNNYYSFLETAYSNATTLDPIPCNLELNLGADTVICGGSAIIIDSELIVSPYGDSIKIVYDAAHGLAKLQGESKVYLHSAAELHQFGGWQYVVGSGNQDDGVGLMTNIGTDLWEITIHPQSFYGYNQDSLLYGILLVFRNADGTIYGKDASDNDIYISMTTGNPVSSYAGVSPELIESPIASILWSTGAITSSIIVSTSGNYIATITDIYGCTATDAISVSIGNIPLVDIGNDNVLCNGESIYLVADTGYVSYVWSDASTNDSLYVSTAGVYSLTVTDSNGCNGFDVVNITENYTPIANFNFDVQGMVVTFIDLSSYADTYSWDFDGNGTTDYTSSVNVTKTYYFPGQYNVILTVTNVCGTDTHSEQVVITNIEELISNGIINIYPNPVNEYINIDLNKLSVNGNIRLFNILGEEIVVKELISQFSSIDLSSYSKGIYFLELNTNNQTICYKIIKN